MTLVLCVEQLLVSMQVLPQGSVLTYFRCRLKEELEKEFGGNIDPAPLWVTPDSSAVLTL